MQLFLLNELKRVITTIFRWINMTTSQWKKSLRTEPSPSESKIRHGLLYVPMSLFAKQFYCEQQLEFDYQLNKPTSEEEKLGYVNKQHHNPLPRFEHHSHPTSATIFDVSLHSQKH